jgi:hypothetical protein
MPAAGLCDAVPPLLAHVLPFLIALVGGPGSAGSSSNVSRAFLCDFTSAHAAHLAENKHNLHYRKSLGSLKGLPRAQIRQRSAGPMMWMRCSTPRARRPSTVTSGMFRGSPRSSASEVPAGHTTPSGGRQVRARETKSIEVVLHCGHQA